MNGARLGIAAQSVGLSQAAYNEGMAYAKERKQFGKAIIDFPAVYDMLSIMKAKLDAGLHCCIRLHAMWISTKRWMIFHTNAN